MRDCSDIDFIYVPHDFKTGRGKGFGFVNFTTRSSALKVFSVLHGFDKWREENFMSRKKIQVCWARPEMQGRANLIEFFSKSTVMNSNIEEEYKPLLVQNGRPLEFPRPRKGFRHSN